MIKLGTSDLSKAYVGSTEVSKVYLGSELVYSSAPAPLPYDAELEYLASEQDAKIDTGVSGANNNLSFDFEIMAEPTAYTFYMLGNYRGTSYKSVRFVIESNGKAHLIINANANVANAYKYAFTTGVKHHITATRAKTNVDGVEYTNGTGSSDTANDYNIYIFASYPNPTAQRGKVTIYYFKIYDNGTLIRDYIPVRVGQVGYMYDKVSKTLFGNDGSGSFILGNDI